MSRVYKILTFSLLAFFSNSVSAQSFQLKGIVYSKNHEVPLGGASIQIKGTNLKTLTTDAGSFSLEVPEKSTLVVSYTSYKNIEVPVSFEQQFVTIKLESNDQLLEEVVVTALGISKEKKSLGYAVQELKAKDISTSNEPNLVNALSGKVAGVRITNSQGDMGSARIIIRGETSISGNNQPLFVVNGLPVDNSQLGAGGSRDYANAISDINANDIESISVLKGPNAAALYGSRAAAGVILIKTKSGKATKGLGISVNSEATFQDLLTLPSYQNKFGQGSDGKFSYVDGKGGGINDGTDESWGPRLDGQLIPQFYSKGEPVPFVAHPNNVRDFFRTGYV
ncbi:MAG: TonB-dependent receptor plug domain-containing protein, partial [Ginsengibacter sp.]